MVIYRMLDFAGSDCVRFQNYYCFNSEGTEKIATATEKRERQPFPKRPLNPNVRWHLICVDMDDWEGLAELLKDSKVKCERDLYKCIVEDFLPAIPDIIEARVSVDSIVYSHYRIYSYMNKLHTLYTVCS